MNIWLYFSLLVVSASKVSPIYIFHHFLNIRLWMFTRISMKIIFIVSAMSLKFSIWDQRSFVTLLWPYIYILTIKFYNCTKPSETVQKKNFIEFLTNKGMHSDFISIAIDINDWFFGYLIIFLTLCMMNWKGCGRKQPWHILSYYSTIY